MLTAEEKCHKNCQHLFYWNVITSMAREDDEYMFQHHNFPFLPPETPRITKEILDWYKRVYWTYPYGRFETRNNAKTAMLTTQEAMFCPTANRAGRPRNAVLDHKNILPHNPVYYTSTTILINTIFDHETCLARG